MRTQGAPNVVPDSDEWAHHAPLARPLFKWAGGKQRFLWDHRHRFPEFTGTYHEPFAGGLSVYFHIAGRSRTPVPAVIGDLNLRVARTYDEIKWEPAQVSDQLRQLEAAYNAADDKAAFYADVRATHNRVFPKADAARFIFLMSTGFNGVFRVNQSGGFNVPHGVPRDELKLPTKEDVKAVSVVLQSARIRAQSWESALNAVMPGDFAFFDPPYFDGSERRDLYDKSRSFTLADHVRLADALSDLRDRGVQFLLTNSAAPEMQEMYTARGLNVEVVESHRSIASRASERGKVGELIVTAGDHGVPTTMRSAQLKLFLGDA